MDNLYVVITTIQPPTYCVEKLTDIGRAAKILIVGDKKGPFEYDLPGTILFTLQDQLKMSYGLVPLLPTGHYSRKNLGYLHAIHAGAKCIYETDDDNMPVASWRIRDLEVRAQKLSKNGWYNIYHLYSNELIWPRGLPLDEINNPFPGTSQELPVVQVEAPIQQGLINKSPDVDAIWRLIYNKDISFKDNGSILLSPGTWSPFNSQSTWWWPSVYPLMYLPSYCSFRMTDIWRSFIAQRCLWELDLGVVIHSPEAVQDRNEHNLMADFNDEVPGYQNNNLITDMLLELELEKGQESVGKNLHRCYEHLISCNIFPAQELLLVDAWLQDLP